MSTSNLTTQSMSVLRSLVAVLFVSGIALVIVTALFGFEAAKDTLLLLTSGLLCTAVIAVFGHLAFTRALTLRQKRTRLRRLTGRKAAWAWGEYLTCGDLRAAAGRFKEEGDARCRQDFSILVTVGFATAPRAALTRQSAVSRATR